MKAFVIAIVLTVLFVAGSVFALQPSPRQRHVAKLRHRAVIGGLRVQLRPGEPSVDYTLPWRVSDIGVAQAPDFVATRSGPEWRLDVRNGPAAPVLQALLDRLPDAVTRVVAGAEGVDGVVLTQQSLASHFGDWSRYALTAAILLFAFSSIIYNVYLGENALAAITDAPMAITALRVLILGLVFLGAAAPSATAVFFFSDPMMGVLALVNLVAILMLFPTAMRIVNDFRSQLKAGVQRPIFDPANFPDLDLDRKAWNPGRWK